MDNSLIVTKTLAGPSIGTPNILNLYLKPMINSTAVLNATNSLPKVDDSTVFCRLLY
jgi:hypothetical protein